MHPAFFPVIVAAGFLLHGCAPSPIAAGFPTLAQQKIQSASHWKIIADDVGAALAKFLVQLDAGRPSIAATAAAAPLSLGTAPMGGPAAPSVWIGPASPSDGLFQETFDPMVAAAMLRNGVRISPTPSSSMYRIEYGVTLVPVSMVDGEVPAASSSAARALGSGIMVVAQALSGIPWGITAVMSGLAGDPISAQQSRSKTELVFQVSLYRGAELLHRDVSIYYIPDRDARLYGGVGGARTLNDVPASRLARDLAGQAYVR
jgi:hypothetical protein